MCNVNNTIKDCFLDYAVLPIEEKKKSIDALH